MANAASSSPGLGGSSGRGLAASLPASLTPTPPPRPRPYPPPTPGQLVMGIDLAAAWDGSIAGAVGVWDVLRGFTGKEGLGLGRLAMEGSQGACVKVQKEICKVMHNANFGAVKLRLRTPGEVARLMSQCSKGAAAWMRAARNNRSTVLLDPQFTIAFRWWMGLYFPELLAADGRCPIPASTDGTEGGPGGGARRKGTPCNGVLAPDGDHLTNGQCKHGSKEEGIGRTVRHNNLTKTFAREITEGLGRGRCTVTQSTEACAAHMRDKYGTPAVGDYFQDGNRARVMQAHHLPDLLIRNMPGHHGGTIVLDTSIAGHTGLTAKEAFEVAGAAASKAELFKISQYQSALDARPTPLDEKDLALLVFDRSCAAGPKTRLFIEKVASAIAARVGDKAAGKVSEAELEEAERARIAEDGKLVKGAKQKDWDRRLKTRKARTVEGLMQVCTATIMRGHAQAILFAADYAAHGGAEVAGGGGGGGGRGRRGSREEAVEGGGWTDDALVFAMAGRERDS